MIEYFNEAVDKISSAEKVLGVALQAFLVKKEKSEKVLDLHRLGVIELGVKEALSIKSDLAAMEGVAALASGQLEAGKLSLENASKAMAGFDLGNQFKDHHVTVSMIKSIEDEAPASVKKAEEVLALSKRLALMCEKKDLKFVRVR